MKFTIDIEEFWLEGDEDGGENLAKSLRDNVTFDVVRQIKDSIKDKIDTQVKQVVSEKIEKEIETTIRIAVEKTLSGEKPMKINSYDSNNVTFAEWVQNQINSQLQNHSRKSSLQDHLETTARKCVKEVEDRYDMFASQVIKTLSKQGMLKEGIEEMLDGKEK